jgi:hypothetical protein
MRSWNASERRLVAGLVAAAVLGSAGAARADEKRDCADAYDKTQATRRRGQLQTARDAAVACARDVCPEFIRTDCATWLGEIDQSLPTIVFDVRGAGGEELANVVVSLDGKPWLEALDGRAKPIDPGAHVLRFESAGVGAVEQTVQIREGEKNRRIAASLAPATPVQAPPPATPIQAAPEPTALPVASAPSRGPGPWIVGGIGVAGLVVGAVVGGVVLSKKATADADCRAIGSNWACGTSGMAATDSGRALGPVSTVGFIVGGLGVAGGVVWLALTRSPRPAPTAGIRPVVTRDGASWRLEGSW